MKHSEPIYTQTVLVSLTPKQKDALDSLRKQSKLSCASLIRQLLIYCQAIPAADQVDFSKLLPVTKEPK